VCVVTASVAAVGSSPGGLALRRQGCVSKGSSWRWFDTCRAVPDAGAWIFFKVSVTALQLREPLRVLGSHTWGGKGFESRRSLPLSQQLRSPLVADKCIKKLYLVPPLRVYNRITLAPCRLAGTLAGSPSPLCRHWNLHAWHIVRSSYSLTIHFWGRRTCPTHFISLDCGLGPGQ
jgi:hypothetical protein